MHDLLFPAFCHADIDTNIYMELIVGAEIDGNKIIYVLKLKRKVYGLK